MSRVTRFFSYLMPFLLVLYIGFRVHPLHISVFNFDVNSEEKTTELTVKVFYDDLEKCWTQKNLWPFKDYPLAELDSDSVYPMVKSQMKEYLDTSLSIIIDGQKAKLNVLGFEAKQDALQFYIRISDIVDVQKIEITASFLTDIYPDQENLFFLNIGDKSGSLRLNQEKDKGVLAIE